jgi:hypothetical protein
MFLMASYIYLRQHLPESGNVPSKLQNATFRSTVTSFLCVIMSDVDWSRGSYSGEYEESFYLLACDAM